MAGGDCTAIAIGQVPDVELDIFSPAWGRKLAAVVVASFDAG